MKKILLILSVMCALFLVGCNGNENVVVNDNNNFQETVENQTQENEEQNQDANKENENPNEQIVQTEEEKYKLSDSYYISGEGLGGETLIELSYSSTKYDAHSYVQSDGVEFDITCELKETTEWGLGIYDVKINGEEIKLTDGHIFGVPIAGDAMYLIDLDEDDQYKEIRIISSEGLDGIEEIYRLTKNGLELVFESGSGWDYFTKVNDKVIYTNFSMYTADDKWITKGYYLYENGEFKFIDRLATGEKIADENGMLPENFQKLEFYAEGGDDSAVFGYKDGQIKGTFNIIACKEKYVTEGDFHYTEYDVRLTKDSEYCVYHYNDNGNHTHTTTEIIPAGTILEDVGIDFFR